MEMLNRMRQERDSALERCLVYAKWGDVMEKALRELLDSPHLEVHWVASCALRKSPAFQVPQSFGDALLLEQTLTHAIKGNSVNC
jgi:hypothetical protein